MPSLVRAPNSTVQAGGWSNSADFALINDYPSLVTDSITSDPGTSTPSAEWTLDGHPSDFGTLTALQVDFGRSTSFLTDDTLELFFSVGTSGGAPLTEEVWRTYTTTVGSNTDSITFSTINSPSSSSTWSTARLFARTTYDTSMGNDNGRVTLYCVQLSGTYTASASGVQSGMML